MVQRFLARTGSKSAGDYKFFSSDEVAARFRYPRGDIFVLSAGHIAFQFGPRPEINQSGPGQRSETTSRGARAHRTFQPLLRTAPHFGHGSDRAFTHAP